MNRDAKLDVLIFGLAVGFLCGGAVRWLGQSQAEDCSEIVGTAESDMTTDHLFYDESAESITLHLTIYPESYMTLDTPIVSFPYYPPGFQCSLGADELAVSFKGKVLWRIDNSSQLTSLEQARLTRFLVTLLRSPPQLDVDYLRLTDQLLPERFRVQEGVLP